MRRLLLAAGLLVPLAASADPFVFQPVTGGVGGIGTVTSITPGEGVSSGSDCAVTAITSSGTLSANCRNINEQTDTAHTIASGDCGKLVVLNSGSAFALTLPAASTLSKCEFGLSNIGAGNATITGTIDGVATRVMQRYQGMTLVSDGSVWRSRGVGPGVSVDGLVDPDQLPVATVSVSGAVRSGTCLEMGGTGNRVMSVTAACRTASIQFVIDGGGSAITTGIKGDLEVPFACTITAVRLLADQSGSIVVDLWVDSYANFPPTDADSITASAPPTISSATKSENTTLTGWTPGITAGSIIRVNVDSITSITRVTGAITCAKT